MDIPAFHFLLCLLFRFLFLSFCSSTIARQQHAVCARLQLERNSFGDKRKRRQELVPRISRRKRDPNRRLSLPTSHLFASSHRPVQPPTELHHHNSGNDGDGGKRRCATERIAGDHLLGFPGESGRIPDTGRGRRSIPGTKAELPIHGRSRNLWIRRIFVLWEFEWRWTAEWFDGCPCAVSERPSAKL